MASILSYLRSTIITEVKRMLREKTAGGRFDDVDYYRWADLGCLEVARRTRSIRGTKDVSALSSQANQASYGKSLGMWAVSRIDYDGTKLRGPTPWDRIEEYIPEGKSVSSTGTPKYWCPYGTEFYVWPVVAVPSKMFKIWSAEMPYTLSADGVGLADIGLEEWTGPAVEAYMAYRGHLLDGSLERAQAMYQLFERSIQIDQDTKMPDVAKEQARGP